MLPMQRKLTTPFQAPGRRMDGRLGRKHLAERPVDPFHEWANGAEVGGKGDSPATASLDDLADLVVGSDVRTAETVDRLLRVANDEKELTKLGVTTYTPTAEEWAKWAAVRDKVWAEVAEAQKGKVDINLAKQLADTQR